MTDKELLQEANTTVKAYHEELEKKDKADKVVLKNISDKLDELETANQGLVKKQTADKDKQEELQKTITSIETKFSRFPSGTDASVKSASMKAFDKFLITEKVEFAMDSESVKALRLDSIKYLRTDINPQGGYLAPNEFVLEIIKDITEISPMRQVAFIRQTTRGAIEIPTRTSLVGANWVGEGGDKEVQLT